MKIFQSIISNLNSEGIAWPQKHPFNVKNITILVNLSLATILATLFLLLEAETFSDYGDSFYVIASTIVSSVIFAVIVWKTQEIFKLINSFETIIQEREFDCSFKKRFQLIMEVIFRN